MIAQTKAERLAIIKARKREQKKRKLMMWWNKDAKPLAVNIMLVVLLVSIISSMIWGCALDSENFQLVFKGFLVSCGVGITDGFLLWILGGMEL